MPIKKDEEIAGCITVVPTVKGNLIQGKIRLGGNEEIKLVAFNTLDANIKRKLFNLQLDQTVMVLGRIESESKMGKRVIANDILDAEDKASDISPTIQVEDKLENPSTWEQCMIQLDIDIDAAKQAYDPNASEYPAPLFDGDPYAIDPSRDFLENIKTYKIGELIFYTDGKMYWLKDHKTLRNKVFITSSVQEQFARLDNPLAEFATY
jgi:hypothetical protein